MSLYGALFTGVSSLAANGRALGVSSNNIANVNTVGYKASVAQFETMLSRDTPAGAMAETKARLVVRGSSSTAISAWGDRAKRSRSSAIVAAKSSGFRIVGLPPPKCPGPQHGRRSRHVLAQ